MVILYIICIPICVFLIYFSPQFVTSQIFASIMIIINLTDINDHSNVVHDITTVNMTKHGDICQFLIGTVSSIKSDNLANSDGKRSTYPSQPIMTNSTPKYYENYFTL